ncbi:hypothetical protein [Streptomyces neyagawaensis]|uniref:hypothetical protein n=1 Tax=Streptomyces neyagawaensis TaxID=42238 RepID=UPI0006E3B325|nr:hypothetical protein [Streptomyces neyagawaensis]MCL6732692.1 hypothetical protein [Streptomyces neyagawaensis]MDE1681538.1 hypothetical protein [Streptomyces neyagawaensis]
MGGAHRIGRALIRHELLLLASLFRWMVRRPHGVGEGRAFGYARGQGAMMLGFGFVCVVETVTLSVLLDDHPLAHRVLLALDLYTILIVAGLHAASVTRPHVLTDTTLRLRRFASVDLLVPLTTVSSVRRELCLTHEKKDGELSLEAGSQTTVTLELADDARYLTFFGRPRAVRLVRFHADDADRLVGEIDRLRRAQGDFTPVRSEPSPLPARPV